MVWHLSETGEAGAPPFPLTVHSAVALLFAAPIISSVCQNQMWMRGFVIIITSTHHHHHHHFHHHIIIIINIIIIIIIITIIE